MVEKLNDNQFVKVPGYPQYEVNPLAQIRKIVNYKNGQKYLYISSYPKRTKPNRKQRYVVKLIGPDGKRKEILLHHIVFNAFIGKPKEGYVIYHKNGNLDENLLSNLACIKKSELGKLTGHKTCRRKPVVKINNNCEIVEFYRSARQCAKENFMSYQTIADRCNGKCKSVYAPDGYAYAWDDSGEMSVGKVIREIELLNGYMPKAPDVEFEW